MNLVPLHYIANDYSLVGIIITLFARGHFVDNSRNLFDYTVLGESYVLPLIDTESQTKESILVNSTLLFATRGYGSVSMRDIADSIGIKPASLYNHFASKEALWSAALEHARGLYLLYFKHLDEALAEADSFRAVLETIFHEPKLMANVFTNYAFAMIRAEQLRDPVAAEATGVTMFRYGIDFIRGWLDRCVEKGMVRPFDTEAVASIIINGVMIGIDVTVQRALGRDVPFDVCESLTALERFLLQTIGGEASS